MPVYRSEAGHRIFHDFGYEYDLRIVAVGALQVSQDERGITVLAALAILLRTSSDFVFAVTRRSLDENIVVVTLGTTDVDVSAKSVACVSPTSARVHVRWAATWDWCRRKFLAGCTFYCVEYRG